MLITVPEPTIFMADIFDRKYGENTVHDQ